MVKLKLKQILHRTIVTLPQKNLNFNTKVKTIASTDLYTNTNNNN